jgi:hypothetical protein
LGNITFSNLKKKANAYKRIDVLNPIQGVPEKEQKQTKTSGRFPDLKIFNGTNV